MKILIADDHDLLRDTLGAMLSQEVGADVVYTSDLNGALMEVKRHRFDLVLLDYSMPGMNGYDGLSKAVEAAEGTPVALMSGTAPTDAALICLERGAAGFVPKTMPARSFLNAVRFMVAGEQYLPPQGLMGGGHAAPASALSSALTDRERQVLRGLCDSLSNKEIARRLEISEPTVKVHAQSVFRKIGARNRTHAALIARQQGFS